MVQYINANDVGQLGGGVKMIYDFRIIFCSTLNLMSNILIVWKLSSVGCQRCGVFVSRKKLMQNTSVFIFKCLFFFFNFE